MKYAVMTECRDFRFAVQERARIKKYRNLVLFLLGYIPVMTFFGMILVGFAASAFFPL